MDSKLRSTWTYNLGHSCVRLSVIHPSSIRSFIRRRRRRRRRRQLLLLLIQIKRKLKTKNFERTFTPRG